MYFDLFIVFTIAFFLFSTYLLASNQIILSNFIFFKSSWSFYIFQKLISTFFFLLLPIFFVKNYFNILEYSFFFINPISFNEVIIVFLAFLILLCILFFYSKREENLINYPQLKINKWTINGVFLNIILWAIYLFNYEFFFRGILFLFLIENLNINLLFLIILNTFFYAASHVPKGKTEVIACIPFGILLCYITYFTNSIFCAFIIHLILASFNDIFSIYYKGLLNK